MVRKVRYSHDEFNKDLIEIIRQMYVENFRPDLILGITRGGLIPAAHLSHFFDLPLLTVNWSFRDHQSFNVNLDTLFSNVEGKTVLGVDDICDTGRTFDTLNMHLQGSGAKEIRWACLHNNLGQDTFKPSFAAREINKLEDDVWIDYTWETWWR